MTDIYMAILMGKNLFGFRLLLLLCFALVGFIVSDLLHSFKSILNLTLTDLSKMLGVSRSVVYGMMINDLPIQEDVEITLKKLYHCVKDIERLQLHRPDLILRRPLFDGKSAIDLLSKGILLTEDQLLKIALLDCKENAIRSNGVQGKKIRSSQEVVDEWCVPIFDD